MKLGWQSKLKYPNFDIREDEDFVYIYRDNALIGTFNHCTTQEEIAKFCSEELRKVSA